MHRIETIGFINAQISDHGHILIFCTILSTYITVDIDDVSFHQISFQHSINVINCSANISSWNFHLSIFYSLSITALQWPVLSMKFKYGVHIIVIVHVLELEYIYKWVANNIM